MKTARNVVLGIAILFTTTTFSQYSLDVTFGTDGKTIVDAGGNEGIPSNDSLGHQGIYVPINAAIAIDVNDKIIIAGNTTAAPQNRSIITRLNADGSFDLS